MAHTGTPRTKFLVPSIGSTTQRRWLWPVAPVSSPMTASRGRARDERAPDALLHRVVGVGDRRQVGLGHHVQVERLEPRLRRGVGVVGQDVRQPQVVGVVGRHGPKTIGQVLQPSVAPVPSSHGVQRLAAPRAGRARHRGVRAARGARAPSCTSCRSGAGCCAGRCCCVNLGAALLVQVSVMSGEQPRGDPQARVAAGAHPRGVGAAPAHRDVRARGAGGLAFWALGYVTRLAGGADRPAKVAALETPMMVLLPIAGGRRARARLPHRRRRRPGGLGLSSVLLGRLAAGQQPPERLHPLGLRAGRLVEPALGLALAVGAAARAVDGQLVQVGEGLDQVVGLHVRQPEGADPGGVDDPAAPGQRQHQRAGRGVPPATGHRVHDADLPVGVGHQRVDQRRLADAAVAEQHAGAAREPVAELGEVAAALGDDVGHPQRAVARQQRLRGGQVGLGQAEQRVHAGVVGGHQGPVDQPRAGLGVGERGRPRRAGRRWPRSPARRGRRRRRCGAAPSRGRRPRRSARGLPSPPDVSPTSRTRSPTTTPLRPRGRDFIATTSASSSAASASRQV